jgi:hypothetical protein
VSRVNKRRKKERKKEKKERPTDPFASIIHSVKAQSWWMDEKGKILKRKKSEEKEKEADQ